MSHCCQRTVSSIWLRAVQEEQTVFLPDCVGGGNRKQTLLSYVLFPLTVGCTLILPFLGISNHIVIKGRYPHENGARGTTVTSSGPAAYFALGHILQEQ